MTERKIVLVVAYDGTDFCGWQIQNQGRSVQGEIEAALEVMHRHPVRITGSGRTDSGVHASGQIVHFVTDIPGIPAEKFAPALNRLMGRDVRIYRSCEVNTDFHARFDAVYRQYKYRFYVSPTPDLFRDRFAWGLRTMPDIRRLNALAGPLTGVHDFETFTAAGDPSKSRVRHLYSAAFYPVPGGLEFQIAGNAFLWRMVRSIVGTLMDLQGQGAEAGDMKRVLESRDRNLAGTTAPARGLSLEKVLYERIRF